MSAVRVLVVDDDDVDRETIRRLLTRPEPTREVFEAASIAEALEHLRSSRFDCVLLDYHLGDSLGTELLDDIETLSPTPCPVIMVTGRSSEQGAVAALRRGVYDYLPKAALDRGKLITTIDESIAWARNRAAERASERRFEELAGCLPQHVWTATAGGSRDFMSRQWFSYTGVCNLGEPDADWADRVLPADRDGVLGDWRTCVERGSEFRSEHRIRRFDGEYRWFDVRAVPIRGPNSQVLKWVGSNTDVHEAREMRDSLRQQALLIDLAPDPILVWSLERGVILWNRACARLYGYSREAALGTQVSELLHTEECPGTSTRESGATNGDLWVGDLIQHTKSGLRLIVSSHQQRIVLGENAFVLEAHRDITDHVQAEERQRRSHKLEALGTLAAGVAHDFNNILLGIGGYTQLARDELPATHPAQGSLLEIDMASDRAADLVRRIMLFTRQEERKPELLDLRAVVQEALMLVRRTLPSTIELLTDLPNDLPAVSGDSTQVHQTMINLVTNAAHAVGRRAGVIRVSMDEVTISAAAVARQVELREDRYLRVTVKDNGNGIEKAILPRIFDPFFTTKGPGQGTGLGLSVVHGIMRAHGGAVTAESEPGKETILRLYFPVARVAAGGDEKPAVARTAAPNGRGGEKILYVDDEESHVRMANLALARLGYVVRGFTDSVAALQAFRIAPEQFDVVVTDLTMPGLSGFDLSRELLKTRPGVPIILTSGKASPEDEAMARRIGVSEFLLKPYTFLNLGVAIQQVCSPAAEVNYVHTPRV
jgi:PAS domain S-box-containing protein